MLGAICITAAIILPLFYYFWTKNYSHWSEKGVTCLNPTFPFGNIKDLLFINTNLIKFLNEAYKSHPNSKVIGFYALRQPMLILKDLDYVKNVLIKDFNNFSDNGFFTYESVDALMGLNPFGLRGDEWKISRSIHTPVHTASKIKTMIPQLIQAAKTFVEYIKKQNKEVNVNELSRFYTIDSVASCAFSVESDSFNDKNAQFIKFTLGQLFTDTNVGALAAFFAPWFSYIFRVRVIQKVAENFFLHLAHQLLEDRKKSKVIRNDLVQHLISVQEKAEKEGTRQLKQIEIAAQLMTFYLDGSETASMALTFTLFEIAAHEDMQEKLRDEIKSIIGKSTDDFDFEKIRSLDYLDMIISESLRLNAPIPLLSRICVQDYMMDGIKIEKGTKVFIPTYSIHHDPDIYPEPDKFEPERFSKENRSTRHNCSYLPFGEGPRICMGFRFAITDMKVAIIMLLLNFKLILSSRHPTKKIIFDGSSSFVYSSKESLYIKFEPIV